MGDMIGESLAFARAWLVFACWPRPHRTRTPVVVAGLQELAASCLERGIVRHCP